MTAADARRRFAGARVARLATADADGRPHLVPIVFALAGDRVYTAVDAKPKRTTALRRLANVAANPRVAILVDHYDEDWSTLWWVRVHGTATVVEGRDPALAVFPPYRQAGAVAATIVLVPEVVTGWRAG